MIQVNNVSARSPGTAMMSWLVVPPSAFREINKTVQNDRRTDSSAIGELTEVPREERFVRETARMFRLS